MKKIILILAVALQYCTPVPKNESPEDNIKKVETGLINPVYLEGDSTWTIEARMKHYHVPGVSIAVIHNGKIAWLKSYGVMDEETKEPVTSLPPSCLNHQAFTGELGFREGELAMAAEPRVKYGK